MNYLENLISHFRKLPSVGAKTAARYAYSVIEGSNENAAAFAQAIIDAKENTKFCSVCGNYTEDDVCPICSTRDKSVICVVAQAKDIAPFERTGFTGTYHVLHGVIDFQKNVTANDIRIKELLARAVGAKEIIIATNPDINGELTASYIANLMKSANVKVSRLAYGISVGAEIEYADELTLSRALTDRKIL